MINYEKLLYELNELLPENSYKNGIGFTYETTGYSDAIRYGDLVIYCSETSTIEKQTNECVFAECMKELYNIRRNLNHILVNSNIYENPNTYENFNNMGPSGTTSKPKYEIGDWVATNPYYKFLYNLQGEVTDVVYDSYTHSWHYVFLNIDNCKIKISENWLLEIVEPKFKVGDRVFQHHSKGVNSNCRIEKLKWNYDQMIWEYVLDKAREDLYFPESELTSYFKVGNIIRNKLTKEIFRIESMCTQYLIRNLQNSETLYLQFFDTNNFELV